MPEKNYAFEWYRYGLDNDDDSVIRFMMHWIAFSWLYKECRKGDEKRGIRAFCEKNYDILRRYNAFNTGAFLVFEDGPVKSEWRGETQENNRLYNDLMGGSEKERIISLFLTIYHIRCNLFHGSKSLLIPRDKELVRSSAIILEGYLKELLNNGPSH